MYKKMGAFGYGYYIEIHLSDEIIKSIKESITPAGTVKTRFEASDGGLALYGCRTGRYGINPLLILM